MNFPYVKVISTGFSLFLLSGFALSQSNDASVKGTESQLKQLQERIQEEQKKRKQAQEQEKSVLHQLDSIGQRIHVQNEKLDYLQNQLHKNETNTQKLQRELEITQTKLNLYQTYLAGRVRSIYIANHVSPYQRILTATNYSDEVRSAKYQRILAYADAKSVADTRFQTNQIHHQKFQLSELIRYQQIQEDEVSRSKEQYENQQQEKSNLLTKVQTDKVAHEKMIQDLESAAKRLENLLVELRKHAEFPEVTYSGEAFSQMRGRLIWPVSNGTVIYGPGIHSILNGQVPIVSHGIGIKASSGADVYAVHNGQVLYAGWLEGSGNTIIIDHGQQFMTLYMHLLNIAVKKGQVIERKQKIGTVGDTGSLEGTQLEFQIRKGTSSLDPQDWLVKR